MIQIKSYTVEEVFAAMEGPGKQGTLSDGVNFKKTSPRMMVFKEKGTQCVRCDVNGSVFILETQHEDVTPHLNLYGEDENGELMLLTKDHILPKSKGGANELNNYQTMCTECNRLKSNTLEEETEDAAENEVDAVNM